VDELGLEARDESRDHECPTDDEDGARECLTEVNGDLQGQVSKMKGLKD
jgi:hypothetical protein